MATLLIIMPPVDALLNVMPLDPTNERWRFGAVGALTGTTPIPLLGFVLALALAQIRDHRMTQRIIGWIGWIMVILLIGSLVMFILDFIQTRADVRIEFRDAMDTAAFIAMTKIIINVAGLILIGRSGIGGPKPSRRSKRSSGRDAETPLIRVPGSPQSD